MADMTAGKKKIGAQHDTPDTLTYAALDATSDVRLTAGQKGHLHRSAAGRGAHQIGQGTKGRFHFGPDRTVSDQQYCGLIGSHQR